MARAERTSSSAALSLIHTAYAASRPDYGAAGDDDQNERLYRDEVLEEVVRECGLSPREALMLWKAHEAEVAAQLETDEREVNAEQRLWTAAEYVRERLELVEGSYRELCVHHVAGMHGQVQLTKDRNGRPVFAFWRHRTLAEARKLSPSKSKPLFFPPALVFAHLRGEMSLRLKGGSFARWVRRLDDEVVAAGLLDRVERPKPPLRYTLPWSPSVLALFRGDVSRGERERLEQALGRRVYTKRIIGMIKVAALLTEEWEHSARKSRSGFPCAVRVAVKGYLTKRLALSRDQATGALNDLMQIGFAVRAMYVPNPNPKKRGFYRYLPGTGEPPRAVVRLTPGWASCCMRAFLRKHRVAVQFPHKGIIE